MSTTDLLYVARAETVEMIERGKDNILTQPMYDAGALVAPTAVGSTCTVYDATNTSVATPTVSVASSIARATITAATTTSLTLSEGWRIEWALLMPDSTTRLVRRDAALVRTRLLPPATWTDIFRREPGLNPSAANPIHSMTLSDLDPYLDEAWIQIETRLMAAGRRPWLVISPQALREPLITGTLALIFQAFVTRLKPAYQETAAMYLQAHERAWTAVRLAYDTDDDGAADGGAVPAKVGAASSVWLGSSRHTRGYWP